MLVYVFACVPPVNVEIWITFGTESPKGVPTLISRGGSSPTDFSKRFLSDGVFFGILLRVSK